MDYFESWWYFHGCSGCYLAQPLQLSAICRYFAPSPALQCIYLSFSLLPLCHRTSTTHTPLESVGVNPQSFMIYIISLAYTIHTHIPRCWHTNGRKEEEKKQSSWFDLDKAFETLFCSNLFAKRTSHKSNKNCYAYI